MPFLIKRLPVAALALITMPAPAAASDDAFELWLNPSASFALDDDTAVEIETAQRFRSASDGRPDTYLARLWINQDLSDTVTLSGGIEGRINDDGDDETRFLQQLSTKHGVLRTRVRLEQRFVQGNDGRMGVRFRPRLGVAVPIAKESPWSLEASAEPFVTLRGTSAGGDKGLTALRTQAGVSYEVNDRVSVGLAYLRQQDIVDGGPDRVGHAPLIELELSF